MFFLFFATLKVTLTVAEVYYESCVAVRSGKKSPNQETGLGNRGHLKVLNDTKFVVTKLTWFYQKKMGFIEFAVFCELT